MKQQPEFTVSLSILLALLGLAFIVPSLFAPSPVMVWAAYTCWTVVVLLTLFRVFMWCSENLNLKQWLIATVVSLLLPVALIIGLRWAHPDNAPPISEQAGAAGPARVPDAAAAALMADALSQTRPGYTSETLMQVPRGRALPDDLKYDDLVFRDSAGNGANIALMSSGTDHLVLSVTGKDGNQQALDLPVGPGGVPLDQNVSLAVEAGNWHEHAYLRALVDGNEVAARAFPEPIDFGDRDWKSQPTRGDRLTGVKIAAAHRFVTPWALSNAKLAELVASTRAKYAGFFAGDDTILYQPLGSGPIGPSPVAGTFMLPALPPE